MEEKILLKKRLLLIAIFLVSLLAMSAVSATDSNTMDEIAAEDNVMNDMEFEDVLADYSENSISVADDGTFTALQNKIIGADENSTVTLENDYKYDEGFDIIGIIIHKNLTIDGNGHTIDALGESRIFLISADGVVLKNITFCNGNAKDDFYNGGAVLCSASDAKNILISIRRRSLISRKIRR